MSYLQFPEDKYIVPANSNGTIEMGYFSADHNFELRHITADMYIKGTLGGTEQVRINLFSSTDLDAKIVASDWMNLANILDENDVSTDGNWLGWIRFDFGYQSINKNLTYYAQLEFQNYTRNGDTFYIGAAFDWPQPTYKSDSGTFIDQPIQMKIYEWS